MEKVENRVITEFLKPRKKFLQRLKRQIITEIKEELMENKKETPAQIAERALRNFKNGTPIPVLLGAVEKALSESIPIINSNEVWSPEPYERYCTVHPSVSDGKIFSPISLYWIDDRMDNRRLELGWVFRTMDEAQSLCDKLNEAIKDFVS